MAASPETIGDCVAHLCDRLRSGEARSLSDTELSIIAATADEHLDPERLLPLLNELGLRITRIQDDRRLTPWLRSHAQQLGCDEDPEAVAGAIERLLQQRERMRRTVGQLRGKLACLQKQHAINGN